MEIKKKDGRVISEARGHLREWCTGQKPREVKCSNRAQLTVSPLPGGQLRWGLRIVHSNKLHGSPKGP